MSTTKPIYHNRVGSDPWTDLPRGPLPSSARANNGSDGHATAR